MHLFLEKCCGLALRFQHQLMLLFRLLYRQRSKADVSPDSELQNVTDMTDIKILAGWGKSLGEHVLCAVLRVKICLTTLLRVKELTLCNSVGGCQVLVSEWHPPKANIIEKDLHLESFDCTVLWSELTGNLLIKIFSFMIKWMQELDEMRVE